MWELFKSFSLSSRIGGTAGLLAGLGGCAVAIYVAPVGGTIMVVVALSIIVLGSWLAFRPQIRRNRFDIPAFQPGGVLQVVIDPKNPKIVAVV
jgi:hypothetical protein